MKTIIKKLKIITNTESDKRTSEKKKKKRKKKDWDAENNASIIRINNHRYSSKLQLPHLPILYSAFYAGETQTALTIHIKNHSYSSKSQLPHLPIPENTSHHGRTLDETFVSAF